jgi:hypothetical protein
MSDMWCVTRWSIEPGRNTGFFYAKTLFYYIYIYTNKISL